MKKICLVLLLVLFSATFFSATGDTTHVITHNALTVVTNPSSGWNSYLAWGVFPAPTVSYRKILLNLKYKCPTGMSCGEWDYLDYVIIRRKGGVNDTSLNMEIARFITPYGNSFTSTFKADWTLDLTDYALLLHDSVEIEYQHTGYETNVGRGWNVTVDFSLIEGTPVMEPVKISQVWNGSFPYGNSSNTIENYLTPWNFSTDSLTQLSRLRMLQTGHGADDNYCAEFCAKNRFLYFDNVLVDTKLIWRLCGKNALYPQGGTWVYDRGNWCPGATVFPDRYDFLTAGSGAHSINADMAPYTSSSPSANYVFGSQLIEYKLPQLSTDASIEDILAPNSAFERIRMNPICHNPEIVIKNNSLTPLTGAVINYGLNGQTLFTFNWSGNLAFDDTAHVSLPGITIPLAASDYFTAYFSSVNGGADQYAYDDTMRVPVLVPALVDSTFFVYFKTNNNPWENDLHIEDDAGNIVYQKTGSNLGATTAYKDTLFLNGNSCYRLVITDNGGDGLSWWANSSQGTGLLRFLKLSNSIIKNFNGDFGSEIIYEFMTKSPLATGLEQNEMLAELNVFPNPNNGTFTISCKMRQAGETEVKLCNLLGEIVYLNKSPVQSPDFSLTISDEKLSEGVYFLSVKAGNDSFSKKIIITR
jgi:hypothetical protein